MRLLTLFSMILGICFLVSFSKNIQAQNKTQPNILVIMSDDVGWLNVSCYHQGLMSSRTPNIDRIAAEGMRFTDYYAQPSCTAGRAAFITGQLPIRTGLTTVGLPGDPIGLHPDEPTMAKLLKELGYNTGQFGKNHLGDRDEFLPTMNGFDEYWGWLYHLNAMEYTEDFDWPKTKEAQKLAPRNILHCFAEGNGKQKIVDDGPCLSERMKTLDDEVTNHTQNFIRKSVKAETPFFVWMCPARAHIHTHLSDKYKKMLGTNGWGLQEVVMKELDDNVGKMLDLLDELKIADNTIVVFTSDNGPEVVTWPDGGMTPFRSEKGTTWEGGFRVPMVIRWPDKIPANKVSNEIFAAHDFLPTFVAAAGGSKDIVSDYKKGRNGVKVHMDGYNLLPLLTAGAKSSRQQIFYYEGKQYQALRYGDWKVHFMIQTDGPLTKTAPWFGAKEKLNAPLLFNLRRDPFEKTADESGYYYKWVSDKMWVFGFARKFSLEHAASFKEFPPRTKGNEEANAKQAAEATTRIPSE